MGRIIGLEPVEKIIREFYDTEFKDLVDAGWKLEGGHFAVDPEAKIIHYCYTDHLDPSHMDSILREHYDDIGEDFYAVDVFIMFFISTLMEARYYNEHKGEKVNPKIAEYYGWLKNSEFSGIKVLNLMMALTDPLLYMLKENEVL